jgi:hypothetical protein
MAKFIHIADTKGRDANVLFTGFNKKSKINYFTPEGKAVHAIRVLKTSINGSYDKLLKQTGDDAELAKLLISDNPEIDLMQTGVFLDGSAKVYIDADFEPCVTVNLKERVFDANGDLKEERIPKELLGNILEQAAIKPSGKLFAKAEVYTKFVFSKKYQLSHVNGLTFDFLYQLAKELDEKKSLMLIGAGEKGIEPLVFQNGGKAYRAFLEGRVNDTGYVLIMHLSNLELKSAAKKA